MSTRPGEAGLTIVLALKDELTRLGVQTAIEARGIARVVAALDRPDRIDQVLDAQPADILILDVRFRREDPSLLPGLARRHPTCRVVMYVAHTAQQCALRHLLNVDGRARLTPSALRRIDECCLTSLRVHARGCIPSEASATEVVQAVLTVAAGRVAAAPWLSEFAEVGARNGQPAITPRELDVLASLAKGLSNKAIARHLGIRERTVKNHIARLMSKLGLKSRAQVGVLAARHNVRVIETHS